MTETDRADRGQPAQPARIRAGRWLEPALLTVETAVFAAGGIAWLAGARQAADACWAAGAAVAIAPALGWVVAALRRGRTGVDVIAVLSLAGTLVVGEYLAGSLIAVMLATGRALEAAAQRRATRDLRALLEHAPRSARRLRDGVAQQVPLDQVRVGDLLLVGSGEVAPVDGVVEQGPALLDESVLTGEAEQVERPSGDSLRSGVVNAGGVFHLRATATAEDSAYAEIVRLARQAGAERAPLVRLADRYAAWFLPGTLLVAGAAWLASGSAVRAVAVLVVATPCPLLLAAPVAIVSGLSRAARRGVVVRDGGVLETLGRASTLVLDKTGTLTLGRPRVIEVLCAPDSSPGEVLRLAASLDQVSPHVLAAAITQEARARGLSLSLPADVREAPGQGVFGSLDGQRLAVGKAGAGAAGGDGVERQAPPWAQAARARAALDGAALVWLTVDGQLTGALLLQDPLRHDAARTLRRLRAAGLSRLIMLTGDRGEAAREVGAVLGLDEVRAEQSPADKVAAVREERRRAVTLMVGDGVNDAPALAAADVGVAMGARGSTASSEAADIVLTTDRVDRLADAVDIAVRARRIATQSALGGMALSLAAMGVAALGWLPPAAGALSQEGIDVAVILNALRALRLGRRGRVALAPETEELLQRFAHEHADLRETVDAIREAADAMTEGGDPAALAAVRRAHRLLVDKLLPHEHAEEERLYPALAGPLGGAEATGPMSRAHAEIDRLSRRIGSHLALADEVGSLRPDQVDDLRACLYGLHAVLRLHFVQEEENYFSLAP